MDPSARDLFQQRLARRPPVRWLHPIQLARVGAQVVAARTLAVFSDRREAEAARPAELYDFSPAPGAFWIDYAADVGDGFDATYAIARSIASDGLPGQPDAPAHGELLVFGGDETYPVASVANYRERTTNVYRAAHPDGSAPTVLAIPGNHDWYDGLESFMRTFCTSWLGDLPDAAEATSARARWIDPRRRGTEATDGWRPAQSRSYFAARLPHGWWMWGIDIQFDGYLDAPQLAYFTDAAARMPHGDSIILCTGKPSWVGAGHPEIATLQDFCDRVLGDRAGSVRLVLSGDRHHYSRYVPVSDEGPSALVTCGGGGAYLSPTHHLPERVRFIRWRAGQPEAEFHRTRTFPEQPESRSLANRFWRLPQRNPQLAALLGTLYAVLGWLLAATQPGDDLIDKLTGYSLAATRIAPASLPALVAGILTLAVGVALVRSARAASARTLIGLAHGVAHLALCVLVVYAAQLLPLPPGALLASVWATLCIGAVCGFAGALLLAGYFFLAQLRSELHSNELFVGLRIEDYKSYLRMCIDRDGVTVHPLGIRTVPHRWAPAPGSAGPLLDPLDGSAAEPIDEPFTIAPYAGRVG